MAKRKNLKTVDLDDLQSLDESEEAAPAQPPPQEPKREPPKQKRPKPLGKPTKADLDRRAKELDNLTAKYHYDRKYWYQPFWWLLAFLLFMGLIIDFRELLFSDRINAAWLWEGSLIVRFYERYYPLIMVVAAIAAPLKVSSGAGVTVFFEGLEVPEEMHPARTLKVRRVSLKWKDIRYVERSSVGGIPVILLCDYEGHCLGQMRLDVDNVEGLRRSLYRYMPADHPLRELIEAPAEKPKGK